MNEGDGISHHSKIAKQYIQHSSATKPWNQKPRFSGGTTFVPWKHLRSGAPRRVGIVAAAAGEKFQAQKCGAEQTGFGESLDL